jgi:1-acyl-sn-glycerol-3-phosphate acyltransferase
VPDRRLVVPDQPPGRALDLRHPAPGDRRREHPDRRRRRQARGDVKHSSTWETLALTLYFPPLAYVAKKELLALPFFGWGFALASPITIDRRAGTDAMQQIATQGAARFAQGFWIVIYPEGTRIRAGTRSKYKTGGARLAIQLGAPLVPVAHNAGWLWPKGTLGKRPGTVTISFGPPISPHGMDAQALTAAVERWIEDEVARLGRPD